MTDLCAECGKAFLRCRKTQKYCSIKCQRKVESRARAQKVSGGILVCRHCGKPYRRKAYRTGGDGLAFCSRACAFESRKQAKPCVNCGAMSNAKYCSRKCERADYRKRNLTERSIECRYCGRVFSTTHKSKRYCSRDCMLRFNSLGRKPIEIARVCQWCGLEFVAVKHTDRKYCSDRCARKEAKMRRRALVIEAIDRHTIYRRDGYTCMLCGDLVDMHACVPNPLAPTIDHIVPLSKGGSHTVGNVQTAHFICNSKKSNRIPASESSRIGGPDRRGSSARKKVEISGTRP